MSSAKISVRVGAAIRRMIAKQQREAVTAAVNAAPPPPLPSPTRIIRRPIGLPGNAGTPGPTGQQAGGPDAAQGVDQRYASFIERFVIERCRDWPQETIKEAAWATVLDARAVYGMIQREARSK